MTTPTDIHILPSADPFEVFSKWFEQVKTKNIDDPTIMTVSTVDNGRPKARNVLLKKHSSKGFTFFTNYNSCKGKEIEANPHGAMTFFWKSCDYQVRIEGTFEKTSRSESEDYFNSRARDSQLASICSQQSEPISSREEIIQRLEDSKKKNEGKDLVCPEHWGGYTLMPDRFIFFIYGQHRINDRFEFLQKDSKWIIRRLQP